MNRYYINMVITYDHHIYVVSIHIPNLVMTFTVRHAKKMALIEIDGKPVLNSMVIFHGYVK